MQAIASEDDYKGLFECSVAIIENARNQVAAHINTGISYTYYEIGRLLTEKKLESKHGSSVVQRLSDDLKSCYPQMGFSARNLWDMKKFFLRYHQCDAKLRQAVAVLPWGDNILLMRKGLDDNAVAYYASETVKKGWSRELLLNAIKLKMHESDVTGIKDNNFESAMPALQAQYANMVFKDTVNLGFLGVTEPIKELELERRIVEKVKQFLLEFGKGFAYIGNQYVLDFNGKEYRVDLLLFHRGLRSLVAIDLKIGEFKPEYIGKMNFYLSLLDKNERGEDENPSIGIILCAEKDRLDVQVALKDVNKPIGVADYKLLIPKQELQQVITDEIAMFAEEQSKETES